MRGLLDRRDQQRSIDRKSARGADNNVLKTVKALVRLYAGWQSEKA
jgi:hypothetical protein